MSDTIKSLAGSIIGAAQQAVSSAGFDMTRRGIITEVLNNGYVVDVNGFAYFANGTPGAHRHGETVSVLFEQNNTQTCLILNEYARVQDGDTVFDFYYTEDGYLWLIYDGISNITGLTLNSNDELVVTYDDIASWDSSDQLVISF